MTKRSGHIFNFCIIAVCLLKSIVIAEDCQEYLQAGNGTKQVDLKSNCDNITYEITTESNSSISRIILSNVPQKKGSNASTDTVSFVKVTLDEYLWKNEKFTTVEHLTKASNESFRRSYFSQSSKMRLTFTVTGNWSESQLIIYYEEITFITDEKNSSDVSSYEVTPWLYMEERGYRPNCVYIFHIEKNESLESSNVNIRINGLDIDSEHGEYLLIGAGFTPFEGPPPLFITNTNGKNQYLVDDEEAYIVFVARSTHKYYDGFNISWSPTGNVIKVDEVNEQEDVREAAPICIYNMTAVEEEFKKPQDLFKDFRKRFAQVATNYTQAFNKDALTTDNEIKASSVIIFRISGIIKVNDTNEALYAMLKITKDSKRGTAAFKYNELIEIIESYTENISEKGLDNLQFGKCPPRKVPESWGNFGLYLIIPVVCCLFILLWTWKQNPVIEYFEKKKRRKRASQHENSNYYTDESDSVIRSAAVNPYTSLPKVQITNDQGRKYTLNLSDVLLSDDNASDDEIFNKQYNYKRQSDVLELQQMELSHRMFLNRYGADNAAFELNEEDEDIARNYPKQAEEKMEHTYESVKSTSNSIEDTKL